MSDNNANQESALFRGMKKLQNIPKQQQGWIDRTFKFWTSSNDDNDWVMDAEWARINQYPLRALRLLRAIIFSFFLLLIWAAFAPLDEIARGDGKAIPSQKLQTLQSLDGGLVKEILVREGQIVDAGDILVRIDPTRFVASFSESRSLFGTLTAEVARLNALVSGNPLIFPESLSKETSLLEQEKNIYLSNIAELEEQQQVYANQIQQRQQEFNEASAAVQQYSHTLTLTQRELNVTKPLLESGAVSDIDILRLEREVARMQGELNRAIATKKRSESAISEARNKQREVRLTTINRWQQQLAESSSKLQAMTHAEHGLADKVAQADIRSPVKGTVQRLHVNTIGGVVTPGKDVVDVVPIGDQLLVEARIAPKDIAFIKPNQPAIIRFSAYDFSIYGGLKATVEHISADTITDEKDQTYYLVMLATGQNTLNKDLTIIPGMTAQVDIITGKKTVLGYLLKPLFRAHQTALSER